MPEARGPRPFRLLTVSGSLRRASTNTAALEALAALAPGDIEVRPYRGLAELPAFNPDDDKEGATPPAPVRVLRDAVAACDGIFIATPEYAHGVPGALKNALDWLVASELFPGKPVALINCAPRAFHAQAALREILATMAARLIPEAFVTLSLTGKTVDAQTILGDRRCVSTLREALSALQAAVVGSN